MRFTVWLVRKSGFNFSKETNLATEIIYAEGKITLDGVLVDVSTLSEYAKSQLDNLDFVEQQILQKNNELQIADSAGVVYLSVLKSGLKN